MDLASIIGICLGFLTIIGVQLIEGGTLSAIIQPAAALIVFGGTFGAIFINFSMPTILTALSSAKKVFVKEQEDPIRILEQILQLTSIARQNGLLSINQYIDSIDNAFLRRGIQLILDINNPQLLYDILMSEISIDEENELASARVFEAMGGFAPTFGIVGAVLGLIQVMGNIHNPAELGQGIATAFVATIYGVGVANLVFLPIAGKLKMNLKEETRIKEMMIHGIISVHLGENPVIVKEKLLGFMNFTKKQSDYYMYQHGFETM